MKNSLFLSLIILAMALSGCGGMSGNSSRKSLSDLSATVAAVELDADSNGYVDESKGGWNGNPAADKAAIAANTAKVSFDSTASAKLAGIAEGAEVNVQPDWNASSGDAQILNKPTIPTNNNQLTNGAGYITSYTETDPLFAAWDKDYGDLINTPAAASQAEMEAGTETAVRAMSPLGVKQAIDAHAGGSSLILSPLARLAPQPRMRAILPICRWTAWISIRRHLAARAR